MEIILSLWVFRMNEIYMVFRAFFIAEDDHRDKHDDVHVDGDKTPYAESFFSVFVFIAYAQPLSGQKLG